MTSILISAHYFKGQTSTTKIFSGRKAAIIRISLKTLSIFGYIFLGKKSPDKIVFKHLIFIFRARLDSKLSYAFFRSTCIPQQESVGFPSVEFTRVVIVANYCAASVWYFSVRLDLVAVKWHENYCNPLKI